jgi:hypothetical protein
MALNRGMFLLRDDDELIEMQERAYDSEALLQGLLAKYPNLLAGDQMDGGAPRRWLLIAREMALPGEQGGAGRWAVDHLFLDQDAIPTVVEVKRSTDTRIRREVVGQMLDYAANAVVYWPIETIRATFEATCSDQARDPARELANFLGDEIEAEGFWQRAKTNLQAGRVRLVFVSDEIPPELRRVVEFLNQQMDPAEALAVEIKQYVGQGLKTLVPRVVGQTAEAQRKKTVATGEGRQWDEDSFFADLTARRSEAEVDAARAVLVWARGRGLRIWWGKGKQDGSFIPVFDYQKQSHYLVAVWTLGYVEMQFQHMNTPPFNTVEQRGEIRRRLIAIPGINIREDALKGRPSFPLTALSEAQALRQFLEILDWMVEQYRAAN